MLNYPPRGAHPCGWIQVPTMRGFLATVQTPKQHLDRFSRFAALTLVTNRQTDRRTDRQTDVLTTLRVYQYRLHIVLRVAMRLKTLERIELSQDRDVKKPMSRGRRVQTTHVRYDTLRYDTRCYLNVRSKADMSQLNLPHGNNNQMCKTEKVKSKNGYDQK